jgi:protoporphyrinogen oxidase
MSSASCSADVAIIGAGPAGLTAAYLLTKQGCSVVVLEADPVAVGGISRTVEYKGFRFDIGGHRFFSKSRAVVELWNELLPHDFIERRRLSRILYEGRFYSYPLRAVEALGNLGFRRSLRCMTSFARARLFPIRNVRSFRDWTVNQFGEELFNIFFKSYTEKVWGIPCEEISADWAAQRIRGLTLWGAVRDGLSRSIGLGWLRRGKATPKTLIDVFHYPRLGPGMMWEAARDRIERAGNKVMMGHAVNGLRHHPENGRWTVSATGPDGAAATVEAAHVVSSAALRLLAGCLSPRPDTFSQAAELKYRDFLTVALILKSSDVFPDNWLYIHDPRVKVGRIQNYRSWSPEMVPDQALTCIGLEYFCFEGDALWNKQDVELAELARREIEVLGLCKSGQVLDAVVVRQEKAYPVYDDGYAGRVADLRAELEERYPTLHLVGRNGMHRYNNQDHSMLTAMMAVRNIMAGRRICDPWSVNEESDYHESGGTGAGKPAWGERPVPARLHGVADSGR